MDTVGNKVAKAEIAMIKVAVPNMACKVIDWAIQAYGGGTNNDVGLASAYATARLLRLADGPDEVHRNQIGKLEPASTAEMPPPACDMNRSMATRVPPDTSAGRAIRVRPTPQPRVGSSRDRATPADVPARGRFSRTPHQQVGGGNHEHRE